MRVERASPFWNHVAMIVKGRSPRISESLIGRRQ